MFFSLVTGAKSSVPLTITGKIEKRLKSKGFPKAYIEQLIKSYDSSKGEQVVKLNILGFLLSPDYSGHVTTDSIKRCREFLKKHDKAFEKAEVQLGVKKEIIAALLWVESRFGENHGRYHVASVYMSLLLAESEEYQQMLLTELKTKHPKPTVKMKALVKTRAATKGQWAVGELWALYKMNKKKPSTVAELKGSYSGAFGYAQFLPSSYLVWAKSFDEKKVADLYEPEDAIISVANYLRKNGFKLGKSKSYKKALFKYNHSDDYGSAILELAEKIAAT
ncbi:MAG: hypothetical protein RJB66_1572 [Pseudomonadota bacterium]|jgi:membrane-bound lytic murein transglycosylase B